MLHAAQESHIFVEGVSHHAGPTILSFVCTFGIRAVITALALHCLRRLFGLVAGRKKRRKRRRGEKRRRGVHAEPSLVRAHGTDEGAMLAEG